MLLCDSLVSNLISVFYRIYETEYECSVLLPDTTPVGRILNRFSKDMETIDASLSWHATFLLQTVLGITAVVAVISAITPEFLVASLIIGKNIFSTVKVG